MPALTLWHQAAFIYHLPALQAESASLPSLIYRHTLPAPVCPQGRPVTGKMLYQNGGILVRVPTGGELTRCGWGWPSGQGPIFSGRKAFSLEEGGS